MILPIGISLQDWADQLRIDFPDEDIPILVGDWHEWADSLLELPTFVGLNAPFPRSFADWSDWAMALLRTMP